MGSFLLTARTETRNPILVIGENLAPRPLNWRTLLAPIMEFDTLNTSAGSVVDITIRCSNTLFIAFLGLAAENYTTNNPMLVKIDAHIYDGTATTTKNMFVIPTTMGDPIRYDFFSLLSNAVHWLWSNTGTITFQDTAGNYALVRPIIQFFTASSPNQATIFHPIITPTLVSSDGFTCVIRLTRSHQWSVDTSRVVDPTPFATYLHGHAVYTWADEAALGIADPADPLNPDKILVTLTPGTHVLTVTTTYINDTLSDYNFIGEYQLILQVY